jgi:hypothetical protein
MEAQTAFVRLIGNEHDVYLWELVISVAWMHTRIHRRQVLSRTMKCRCNQDKPH